PGERNSEFGIPYKQFGPPDAIGQTKVFQGCRAQIGIPPYKGRINDVIGQIVVVRIFSILAILEYPKGQTGLVQIKIFSQIDQRGQVIPVSKILGDSYTESVSVQGRGKSKGGIIPHKRRL